MILIQTLLQAGRAATVTAFISNVVY